MKTTFQIMLTVLAISLTQCKKDNCKETPRGDCGCPEIYDPVCGCNGKVYGNSCEAECNGITDYTKGTCK